MTLDEIKAMLPKIFAGQTIDKVEESGNYVIVSLKNNKMDGLHMINKQTGEITPYNPRLLKGKTK